MKATFKEVLKRFGSPNRAARFITIVKMVEKVKAMAEEVNAEIVVTCYD